MAQPGLRANASSLVTLNGAWERHAHDKLIDIVAVPSSLRPYGTYRLTRSFLLPHLSASERAILHFEAITYFARVFVNGRELGAMAPYVPHEFDFTAHALEGKNLIEVAIVDACPEADGSGKDALDLGVTIGWECYGGIIEMSGPRCGLRLTLTTSASPINSRAVMDQPHASPKSWWIPVRLRRWSMRSPYLSDPPKSLENRGILS